VTRTFSSDCQALIDTGFAGTCAVVKTPTGTIAAVVEHRSRHFRAGAAITTGQERDLVYRQVGQSWTLVLRRIPEAAGQGISQLYISDVMRNRNSVAVFVEPSVASHYGDEIDLVAGTGKVTLYRQLDDGFAVVSSTGGLTTYIPVPSGGYGSTALRYVAALGGWKVGALSHITDDQAKNLASQAFVDPSATQVSPPPTTSLPSITATSTPGKTATSTTLKGPRPGGPTTTLPPAASTSSSSVSSSG
jgi:hypothetical protein